MQYLHIPFFLQMKQSTDSSPLILSACTHTDDNICCPKETCTPLWPWWHISLSTRCVAGINNLWYPQDHDNYQATSTVQGPKSTTTTAQNGSPTHTDISADRISSFQWRNTTRQTHGKRIMSRSASSLYWIALVTLLIFCLSILSCTARPHISANRFRTFGFFSSSSSQHVQHTPEVGIKH